MDLLGKKCVITGAASGIGLALAHKFHEAGADLVLADRSAHLLETATQSLNAHRNGSCHGIVVNLTTEAGNTELVNFANKKLGQIDLFFANAGIGSGTDVIESSEMEWDESFAINFHAHRWAAKALLPQWLERGDGYFCSTASAAGMLTQLGSVPYSVTKHAALAFAEWIAISYGDRGIKVSCLCPQGVNTPMIGGPVSASQSSSIESESDQIVTTAVSAVRAGGDILEADQVAQVMLEAIRNEEFLVLPHPEVLTYAKRKAEDRARWIAGMRKFQARLQ